MCTTAIRVSPGEIKRREVELDSQESTGEIKSRKVSWAVIM